VPAPALFWVRALALICRLRHLAFDVENFDETINKLNELGIKTEPVRTDDRTGKKMTFFKDPDDLPLEICEM
jgi:glyoxylase I family protein